MKQYIGTKLVQAEPAWKVDGTIYPGGTEKVFVGSSVEFGYSVVYQDGYVSWSPKEVFERAYLPVTVDEELRTELPSISQSMVDDFIVAAETMTMGNKCTVVRAMLRNGFEIVESAACVSAENYDEAMGAKICMEKIKDKVWFLLGFLLQTAVNGVDGEKVKADFEAELKVQECCCDRCDKPVEGMGLMTFGRAIEAAKNGLRIARKGWNGKGQFVELATNIVYLAQDGHMVTACHDAIGNQAFAFNGTSGVQMGWLASQADMLAADWYIVE